MLLCIATCGLFLFPTSRRVQNKNFKRLVCQLSSGINQGSGYMLVCTAACGHISLPNR